MNPLQFKHLLKKTGRGVNERTSSKIASNSDELPLSKRKQTGRNVFEQTDLSDAYAGEERDVQGECESWLNRNSICFIRVPDALLAFIYRQTHNGPPGFTSWLSKILMPIRKIVASYLSGVPDLVVLFRNGRYLCAELKNRRGKPTRSQKRFSSLVPIHIFRDRDSFVEKAVEVGELQEWIE
jgi:hypothetical protein